MTILAFLQNMWVNDPARVRDMIAKDTTGTLREYLIEYSLFAGCLTGRRLKAAFGEERCEQIIWEEASPEIDDDPKRYHPPDETHMRTVLDKHKPEIVLCFTKAGESAIRECLFDQQLLAMNTDWRNGHQIHFIPVCHPAARNKDTVFRLTKAAAYLNLLSPL